MANLSAENGRAKARAVQARLAQHLLSFTGWSNNHFNNLRFRD